ncbi:7801_t:CDS:2, partial [Racocetra fulgida]
GSALMVGNSSYHENIYLDDSVLTLKAIRKTVKSENITFNYLSGAIHAKNYLGVTDQYPSCVICGDFIGPMIPGAWPGDKNNNFNIFIQNKYTPIYWDKIPITCPNDWNTYCISMKKTNKTDVKITFSLNNEHNITHTVSGYVGEQFYLIINLEMEGDSG